MVPKWSLAAGLALAATTWGAACSTTSSAPEGGEPGVPAEATPTPAPRNPFGLPDVTGPADEEVRKFAEEAPRRGEASDPNAEAWATLPADSDGLDGKWESRWTLDVSGWVTGTATVRTVGDIIYIHYVDEDEYLIEVRREGDRLVGRYRAVEGEESTPWVGTIISPTRIDGWWARGRWDLRRAEPAAPGER
jgi:hypothetical protein